MAYKPRPLCAHETLFLKLRCRTVAFVFATVFPDLSVTPKFHVLTTHFITIPAVSPGMLSEQSGEALHKEFNRLERRFNNEPNSIKRMMKMMKKHHETHNPAVQKPKASTRTCSDCKKPISKFYEPHCKCKQPKQKKQRVV